MSKIFGAESTTDARFTSHSFANLRWTPRTGEVYRMSPATGRQRGVDQSGEVTNLYQGAAPVNPRERRGEIYPGDQALRDADNVTIQIHTLDLTRDHAVIALSVPVIAVWVPARLAQAWLAQEPQVQP